MRLPGYLGRGLGEIMTIKELNWKQILIGAAAGFIFGVIVQGPWDLHNTGSHVFKLNKWTGTTYRYSGDHGWRKM